MDNKRGRPAESQIRNNIAELLFALGEAYGYDLYKVYLKVFGRVSLRSVYYHLNKGKELGEFRVSGVKIIEGDYSWGTGVKRILYSLGDNAKPKANVEIKQKIDVLKEGSP